MPPQGSFRKIPNKRGADNPAPRKPGIRNAERRGEIFVAARYTEA